MLNANTWSHDSLWKEQSKERLLAKELKDLSAVLEQQIREKRKMLSLLDDRIKIRRELLSEIEGAVSNYLDQKDNND